MQNACVSPSVTLSLGAGLVESDRPTSAVGWVGGGGARAFLLMTTPPLGGRLDPGGPPPKPFKFPWKSINLGPQGGGGGKGHSQIWPNREMPPPQGVHFMTQTAEVSVTIKPAP